MLKLVKTEHDELIINITHVEYIAKYKSGVIIKFKSGEWQTLQSCTIAYVMRQVSIRKPPQ